MLVAKDVLLSCCVITTSFTKVDGNSKSAYQPTDSR